MSSIPSIVITHLAAFATAATAIAQDPPRSSEIRIEFRSWAEEFITRRSTTLIERVEKEIEDVETMCQLTPSQREKLKLAGLGDVKRSLRPLEELRARLDTPTATPEEQLAGMREMHALERSNPTFPGDQSLFRKTLIAILSESQWNDFMRKRQGIVVEKAIELVRLSNKEFQLTDEQHRRLIELLINETEPPDSIGRYAPYIVLYQAAEVEESIRRILNEKQWSVLRERITFARRVVPDLHRRGLLPELRENQLSNVETPAEKLPKRD